MSNEENIKQYLANRQKEIDGAALYKVLADTEKQPQMAEVYRKLAASEEKLRGMAKDYSREWLDYARAAGEDIKKPMALCVSTSGSKKYCEEG